jgi:putative addiction module component (TIGR02574 family)
MSQTTEEIIAAALKLPPESKAKLADELLASLDGPEQTEIDDAWAVEAERRIDEYDRGGIKTIPADQVLRPRQPQARP